MKANKKYAMHIGVNRTDPKHYAGLSPLSGCINDAKQFQSISSAVKFDKVELLTDETATTKNYKKNLKEWAKELEAGDLLWITYSGHGGKKPDLNGDEKDKKTKKGDNWDETWCLYDRELIDDEQFYMYQLFNEGVQIFILSDSCHSGTVSKAVMDDDAEVSAAQLQNRKDWAQYKKEHKAKSRMAPIKVCIETYIKNKKAYDPILKDTNIMDGDIAAHVLLMAACQDNQESIEYGDNGYFTTQVMQSLVNLKKNASYKDLFQAIQLADLGDWQNANLFQYGHPEYDFLNSPIALKAVASKKKVKKATSEKSMAADGLIIHDDDLSKKMKTKGKKDNETIVVKAGETIWDAAYEKHMEIQQMGKQVYVEPNTKSLYLFKNGKKSAAEPNEYLKNWPKPNVGMPSEFTWHLDDEHSELAKAAQAVKDKYNGKVDKAIRIGHIDTGYRDHISQPKFLNKKLGKNFINGQDVNNAEDKLKTGAMMEQDGHGCATMAILAGNDVQVGDAYTPYAGSFGGIPFAEVIPVRISETVYNMFNANDVATGIRYAVDQGCEVITMSMAGYPTKKVAAAVNYAYEKGVTVVTAAGNNWFEGIQKLAPKSVLYPARFERVIAATGACFDHFPYDNQAPRTNQMKFKSAGGEVMQGNWGPEKVMDTAIAAYTPNLPWAISNQKDKYLRNGGGTSSSTPQIAAAAALWIVYNREALKSNDMEGNYKKVEALRKALFSTASKAYPYYKKYYGNGIVRAHKALSAFGFTAAEIKALKSADEAKVSVLGIIPFIGQWFKSKDGTAKKGAAKQPILFEMMATEILQLLHLDPALMPYAEELNFEDKQDFEFLNEPEAKQAFLLKLQHSPYISNFLQQIITSEINKG